MSVGADGGGGWWGVGRGPDGVDAAELPELPELPERSDSSESPELPSFQRVILTAPMGAADVNDAKGCHSLHVCGC